MNPEAQVRFDELLKKALVSLTYEDIAFLYARRDYLKKAQMNEYEELFNRLRPKEPAKKK